MLSPPPPLAYSLGRQLIKVLSPDVSQPTDILTLGEESLLRMDMSSASKYWGVENPIAKRDRKSGNKKRKQSEIEALREANG